jgi:hypothetical protein
MEEVRSGDGPLSVRVRPSSPKRDCDRRATGTGEICLVHVHAKSRLTPEPNADPAGLTARARPKARPETRAANLLEPSQVTAL